MSSRSASWPRSRPWAAPSTSRLSVAKAAFSGITSKAEAEMSNFSEENRGGAARSALAEAGDRFDRLARVVKDQQLPETRSGPRVALAETSGARPEQAWAKNFMTQATGPGTTRCR